MRYRDIWNRINYHSLEEGDLLQEPMLSVVSNWLEQHISSSILKHLSVQFHCHPANHLSSTICRWSLVVMQKYCVFDLSKRQLILSPIHKLQDMGLNDHFTRWISDYLPNRKQFMVANGASSLSSAPGFCFRPPQVWWMQSTLLSAPELLPHKEAREKSGGVRWWMCQNLPQAQRDHPWI